MPDIPDKRENPLFYTDNKEIVYIPLRPLIRRNNTPNEITVYIPDDTGYDKFTEIKYASEDEIENYNFKNAPTVGELLEVESKNSVSEIKEKTVAALTAVQNKKDDDRKGSWHGSKFGTDYSLKSRLDFPKRFSSSNSSKNVTESSKIADIKAYKPKPYNNVNYEGRRRIYGKRKNNPDIDIYAPPLDSNLKDSNVEQPKKKQKAPYVIAIAVEVAFVFSIGAFILAPMTQTRAETVLPEVKETVIQTFEAKPTQTITNTQAPKPVMLPEMDELYSQNSDLAGWIKIEDTPINYPVMYKPQEAEYYLYRDFNRQKDSTLQGSLYIDELNSIEPRDTNILIHGHNMKNGSMFHTLENYKDEEYFLQHPIIEYKTLYENETYEIFAAFTSRVFDEDETDEFIYYKFLNTDNETDFNNTIQSIKDLQLYDTGFTPVYGDDLITLSTCEYSQDNGRMVVMARRVRQ